MFHKLPEKYIEELPHKFTCPYCYEPNAMAIAASTLVRDYLLTRLDWADELHLGKMFGVLIVERNDGTIGFVAAYSGNIDGRNDHQYFVPPIFDCQNPNGHFKQEEEAISSINRQIENIEVDSHYLTLIKSLDDIIYNSKKDIDTIRKTYQQHKILRAEERKRGVSAERVAELIRESQFEKAELKRIEHRWAKLIDEKNEQIALINNKISALRQERKEKSETLQNWLFEQYRVANGRGEYRNLKNIFIDSRNCLPPGGAGECCAPKMLQFAYANCLRPVAMAEFWVGDSPIGEIRRDGEFYPACHSKCEPILNYMLEGVDIEENRLKIKPVKELAKIYEDDSLIIVNKPEGLLSVPGKESSDSVYARLKKQCAYNEVFIVHRLDMATSGLLVVAKSREIYVAMQRKFAEREVQKRYVAIVCGNPQNDFGLIDLPLRLNPQDRPLQVVDKEHGKQAQTRYKVIEHNQQTGTTRVEFYPITGRTHQLRVHSAYAEGLNCPIKGDVLYGSPSDRLYLHAEMIQFVHPKTNRIVKFEVKADF